MTRFSQPGPACRRPDCGEPAVGPHGFCLGHDLRYAEWRAWRDRLERDDLADAGVPDGHEPDAETARALDALWHYLTPGPFPRDEG